MQKTRRSVILSWLASFLRVLLRLAGAHDKRIYAAGVADGRLLERKDIQAAMPPIFGEKPVYIPVASVQFLDSPPPILPGPYAPPEKTTGPIRPLLPQEQRFGTYSTSLPAIDPATGQYVNSGQMAKKTENMRRNRPDSA